MMKLSCKDVDPSTSCNFEATGDSVGEVAGKMMSHVKSDHADKMKGMSESDMMNMMKSKVHE
jgi:predicted small metal-binding protein